MFAVLNPPAAEKKSTSTIACPTPPLSDVIASLFPLTTCELFGKVTPPADIEIVPVPSEEIVDPARSIVLPDR